jgi:hypothetical protein
VAKKEKNDDEDEPRITFRVSPGFYAEVVRRAGPGRKVSAFVKQCIADAIGEKPPRPTKQDKFVSLWLEIRQKDRDLSDLAAELAYPALHDPLLRATLAALARQQRALGEVNQSPRKRRSAASRGAGTKKETG